MGADLVKTVILLATYNGMKYLPDLTASLKAQTDPDFSVLMQDDGSTDQTGKYLLSLCREDNRFSMGSEQGAQLGPAGNFLSLIRQAEGDAFLLCDQDDLWEPEKVAVLKRALLDAEAACGTDVPILVHSDCSLTDQDGNPIAPSFFAHQGWDPEAVTLPRLLVQNNVTGCTLIMNRALKDLVGENGRAKDLFMHDWFIALTAAAFGKVVFVSQQLTRYRQHGENAIGASKRPLVLRAFSALRDHRKIKRRIQLTYTHTMVFRKIYEGRLPEEAHTIINQYLATRKMPKLARIREIRRLGCVMQSPVTRLGQLLFG